MKKWKRVIIFHCKGEFGEGLETEATIINAVLCLHI